MQSSVLLGLQNQSKPSIDLANESVQVPSRRRQSIPTQIYQQGFFLDKIQNQHVVRLAPNMGCESVRDTSASAVTLAARREECLLSELMQS